MYSIFERSGWWRLVAVHGRIVLPLWLLMGCASYHAQPLRDHLPAMAKVAQAMAAALRHDHPASAHPVNLHAPLSGKDLGEIAVLLNPDLRAMRAQIGVAKAQVFAAGLLPDPQLALSADLPSNVAAGYYNAYSMGLSWSLASLFTRSADLHVARAQAHSVQYQVAWQEWLVANQARILARQLYYLQEQEAVSQQAAATTDQLYRTSVQNLRLGDATITTTSLRQIAWLDSQDRMLALRRQVTAVRQNINKVMGLPPNMRLSLRAPQTLPDIPDAARLVTLADAHRLDLLALRAGYQAQEARVRRAILGQYPGFTIGFSRAADTSNIQTIGPSIHLDIPLWNRNRGVIAESEATRAQLHAAYAARLFQTRADITALVADLHRLRQEITPLEQQVPQLQSAEQRLRGAAVEHNVTLIDYEAVRSQALAKSLQLLALKQAYAEQQAALEMAVGLPWQQWGE
ncbi:TolC family protein [Acidithiobacillus ferrivorans]|uniref:TolC family protein n=1 Tax=Acidithiobacillus ferrivorans TaxID=160808 RepID=UPI000AEF9E06|nr:TolC family protein [Acidithiobacillus ferrivorans]